MNKISHDTLSFSFVGDICLAGGMQKYLRENGNNYPFTKVKSAFSNTDVLVGNLECCITTNEREPFFDSKNKMAVCENLCLGLNTLNIDVVTLANNHILDDGLDGLIDTKNFLDKHGILHHGAGINISEAESPLIITKNGFRIAFIGACDVPRVNCSNDRHGTGRYSLKYIENQIHAAKKNSDIIIIQLHADLEFTNFPSPQRVRLSRHLIDLGAHLIIQHHSHVCQGIEYYKNGIIAYSLGNFIFKIHGHEYLQQHSGTDWGTILHVSVKRTKNEISFVYNTEPIVINSDNITTLTDDITRSLLNREIEIRSDGLKKLDILMINRFRRCCSELKSNLYKIYYEYDQHGISGSIDLLLSLVRDPYQRRWMFGIFTLGYYDGPSIFCKN